jgi:hypothetical protein
VKSKTRYILFFNLSIICFWLLFSLTALGNDEKKTDRQNSWARSKYKIESENPFFVLETENNGYVVAGSIDHFYTKTHYTLETDNERDLAFPTDIRMSQIFNPGERPPYNPATEGFLDFGKQISSHILPDIYVQSMDANGKKLWDFRDGEENKDYILKDAMLLQDDGFIITIIQDRKTFDCFPEYVSTYTIYKLNKDGKTIFKKNQNNFCDETIDINDEYLGYKPLDITEIFIISKNKIFVVGKKQNVEKSYFWTAVIDENGNELNKTIYKEKIPIKAVKTPEGRFIVWGQYFGSLPQWVMGFDKEGKKIWEKNHDDLATNKDYQYERFNFNMTYRGGFSVQSDLDRKILKIFDKEGKLKLNKKSDGTIYGLMQTKDGGALLLEQGLDKPDNKIKKLDAKGNDVWEKSLENIKCLSNLDIVLETRDGGYILKGETWHKSFVSKQTPVVVIIKLDKNGNKLWENSFISKDCNTITQTKDNGFLLVMDKMVVKLDENGECNGPGCSKVKGKFSDKAVKCQ